MAVAANLLFALAISVAFSVPLLASFLAVSFAGEVMFFVKRKTGTVAFDGLAVEAWVPLVMEDFYPSNSFLTAAQDMSSLVDNDKINFAEAGADPAVLKNNTVYPINAAVAADTPLSVELDTYDTESTIVRNAIAIELAYDQRLLYANKHKKALLKKLSQDAAYAYAPAAADATNKVISLADADSMIDGIIDLQAFYNGVDDDGTNRNLVLCPAHMAKIAKEDKVLYKAIMAEPGTVLYGFKIWAYSQNPVYITATGAKAAQGVAYSAATHKLASIAFLGNEVMKAQGTLELFSQLKDPDIKGDKFNFQMRALASSLRSKYSGAILQH